MDGAPAFTDVPTAEDRAAVRRIRAKTLIWLVVFLAVLVAAVMAYDGGGPLARAYPWLAIGSLVVGTVALTYGIGWRRAAAVIHAAGAGDRIAAAYLRYGPQLGSVAWWWTTPPVRSSTERRRMTAVGVLLLVVAVIGGVMTVALWNTPISRGYLATVTLSVIPMLVVGVWAVTFAAKPNERIGRAAGLLYYALLIAGLISLGLAWTATHDGYALGVLITVYGFALNCIRGLRHLVPVILANDIFIPTGRSAIDADVARMAAAEPQVPMDGPGSPQMRRVRARYERRMLLRYTLRAVLLLIMLAAVVAFKVAFGG
ncbi:hypothetical protein CS006_01435 [Bifidobacterium primatium]|uniref:Uncharacterized protein n=1 Tax=Bifidobacterium primatium TaxID=2045438 RepID=A0A2M9HAP3_9BIFI|nr:hypothetical protein [Bifidobacterium primatium]PJM73861.1 hypothetical protein CS006_01435 [Bifidobacterium primatium]